MALDTYCWLAQRLHRVDPQKPALVPWVSLQEQFGPDYGRLRNFRRVFLVALNQVHAVYQDARFSTDGNGMRLHHSRPAVPSRFVQVR
jgi:hypothetical protein